MPQITNYVDTHFNSEIKQNIRAYIAQIATQIGGKLLDFYGSGGMYRFIKENYPDIQIRSIDRDPKVIETFDSPDQIAIDLYTLCNQETERFSTIWTDYCSFMTAEMRRDLVLLPKIMENTGYYFTTLRIGRENYVNAGTPRMVIDTNNIRDIQGYLAQNKIKTELIWQSKYLSDVERIGKKRSTPIWFIVYCFKWKRTKYPIRTLPIIPENIMTLTSNASFKDN